MESLGEVPRQKPSGPSIHHSTPSAFPNNLPILIAGPAGPLCNKLRQLHGWYGHIGCVAGWNIVKLTHILVVLKSYDSVVMLRCVKALELGKPPMDKAA